MRQQRGAPGRWQSSRPVGGTDRQRYNGPHNNFRLLHDDDMRSTESEAYSQESGHGEPTMLATEAEDNVRCMGTEPNGELSYSDVVKGNVRGKQRPRVLTKHDNTDLEWAEYIEGRRSRPFNGRKELIGKAPTLITNRRPERAANKPVVHAMCEGLPAKLLLDSGAECNIISTDLLKKVHLKSTGIRIMTKRDRIRCANGTTMQSRGTVWLNIKLGTKISKHPFKVIPGIFPDLIGGIKLMKAAQISINASQDRVVVGSERIPFLSKVEEELPEVTEN